MYLPFTATKKLTQKLVYRIPSYTWVHTLCKYTSINTKARFQIEESFMWAYPLQQHKNIWIKTNCQNDKSYICAYYLEQQSIFTKCPSLHVWITSTATQT